MKSFASIMLVSIASVLKLTVLPNWDLILWVVIAMIIDFCTGVAKAKLLKQARTSSGYRKTLMKFLQYTGTVLVSVILTNITTPLHNANVFFSFVGDGLLVFMIYIELTSICENLYAVDQESLFGKYVIKRLLAILTFQIKDNPSIKALEEVKKNITPVLIFLTAAIALTGCKTSEYTEQDATNDMVKAHAYHPGVTGGKCHDWFPCTDSVSKQVIYKPGKIDTIPGQIIYVNCDSIAAADKAAGGKGKAGIVPVPCAPSTRQHDSIIEMTYQRDVERSHVTELESDLEKVSATNTALLSEKATLEALLQRSRRICTILIVVIVCFVLWKLMSGWLKKKFTWLQ